jgi:hypothetical protein
MVFLPLTQIFGTGLGEGGGRLRAGASVELVEMSTSQKIKKAQRKISIIKIN